MDSGPNILHINTMMGGGAANSCILLHQGLIKAGVSSTILFLQRERDEPHTSQFVAPPKMVSLPAKVSAKAQRILFELKLAGNPADQPPLNAEYFAQVPPDIECFSFPITGIDIMQSPLYVQADIIHLHWVGQFLDFPTFFSRNKKPIVWTLHDMAPFSGGLHYSEATVGVGTDGLPVARVFREQEKKLFYRNLEAKKKALESTTELTVVSPTHWLSNLSQHSELFSRFPHVVIPYGMDSGIFKIRDKAFARDLLQLPEGKKIILFVADVISNHRKGFAFLKMALEKMEREDVLLCAVGSSDPQLPHDSFHYLGRISDARLMSLAYAAADVFVIPSLEDNLPNTMLESLLCGTPVIGYPVGGIAETIADGVNGYLCSDISVDALEDSLIRFLNQKESFDSYEISEQAKTKFNLQKQAKAYIQLYSDILDKHA